jgi:cysteine protease ATG4
MTYRTGFPSIKPTDYTTDIGWGCMLRSGQMLLANAFIYHFLGRDYRISNNDPTLSSIYYKIIGWFLDSNTSPYSIHSIALLGLNYDKEIGQWFGPSTISVVLKSLVQNHKESKLEVFMASDGVVYLDELSPTDSKFKPVLILIPLRLGLDKLNPVYIPGLKLIFEMECCVGIAGGKPNSSFFFIGYEGENMIYLDPHAIRQAVTVKDITSYSMSELSTYQCQSVKTVPIVSLDPSLVVGFYCKTKEVLDDFCETTRTKLASGKTPLFSIEKSTPNYEDLDDLTGEESDF